ncbi:unnamed protein product [Sphagnum balticum]
MEASFTCEIRSTTGPPNFERFHSDGSIVDMGDKINYLTTQLARFHSFSVDPTPRPPTGFEQFNFLRIPARVTAMELVLAS